MQVRWMPIIEGHVYEDEETNLEDWLSPNCVQEEEEWRLNVPLIFFHIVEIHLPVRVCRQFGKRTGVPPMLFSTSKKLHRYIQNLLHMHFNGTHCGTLMSSFFCFADLIADIGTRRRIGVLRTIAS
jgi:hypothetical protein